MKIEIEDREVDTLPNDMQLGQYVRYKMHQAKKYQTDEIAHLENVTLTSNKQPSWISSVTNNSPLDIDWDINSNKI